MAVFEGSEKRLEVAFRKIGDGPWSSMHVNGGSAGLRELKRNQLDILLDDAACKIISGKSTDYFDAYVLSESSLFVYAYRFVLKTCGTTKLLDAVPRLLTLAHELGLEPVTVRFSRASFLFPEDQPAPHKDFQQEIEALKLHCGTLAKESSAYVLGDQCAGLQWHIFEAGNLKQTRTDISLEICMTGLAVASAKKFVKDASFVSASVTTKTTGIADLLPGADIDDVVFSPCGYSMNGLLNEGFLTIHVTPEDTCSYASVEFSGFEAGSLVVDKLVSQVVGIFRPENLYVTVTAAGNSGSPEFRFVDEHCPSLHAYICRGMASQSTLSGNKVIFGSFGFDESAVMWTGLSAMQANSETSDEDFEPQIKILRTDESMKDKSNVLGSLRRNFPVDWVSTSSPEAMDAYIRSIVKTRNMEDTFYVYDLSVVKKLYSAWMEMLPRVQPFYAVKCNPDSAMITLLSALGAGFDCASEDEVKLVLGLGVDPSKIIFANACKRPRDIRSARLLGVNLTTFDTKAELLKMEKHFSACNLVLRIRADDPDARCQLGNKYGAELEEVPGLLSLADKLNLRVVGISFHVGSGASNPAAFTDAIRLAKTCFDLGAAHGFSMRVLDIGGGFSGGSIVTNDLHGVPEAVNAALEEYFPPNCGVEIIAEPGRYFAEAAATLATNVYGRREREDNQGNASRDYWITDGLYGSFNCIPYDHATVVPRALRMVGEISGKEFPSTLFGPTCDGLDTVVRDCMLPELDIGDWVVFSNMGAYTLAGASNFNGFDATDVEVFYVWAD